MGDYIGTYQPCQCAALIRLSFSKNARSLIKRRTKDSETIFLINRCKNLSVIEPIGLYL